MNVWRSTDPQHPQHFAIRVFGPLRLTDSAGTDVAVPIGRQRAALERLVLVPNQPVAMNAIREACWPEGQPERATTALKVTLSRLRTVLGQIEGVELHVDEETCTLEVCPNQMDLLAFERLVAHDAREEALALCVAGAPFADFADTVETQVARRRIATMRAQLHRPTPWPAADPAPVAPIVYVIVAPDEVAALVAQLGLDGGTQRIGEDTLRQLLGEADRRESAPSGLRFGLSDREETISKMLCSHMTLREISRQLYISINTTKSHTRSIYRKLGVSSRSEAAEALGSTTSRGRNGSVRRVS